MPKITFNNSPIHSNNLHISAGSSSKKATNNSRRGRILDSTLKAALITAASTIVGALIYTVSDHSVAKSPGETKSYSTQVTPSYDKVEEIFKNEARKLLPLETGKFIGDLPDDIFGYTSTGEIVIQAKYPEERYLKLSNQKITNRSFESQKRQGEAWIVGFVSPETFSKIGSVNENNSLSFSFFPNSYEGFVYKVAIPMKSIVLAEDRRIDIGDRSSISILDLEVYRMLPLF